MVETVLVTGGTGFVAQWCIVELMKRGYAVRTTVRSAAKEGIVRRAVTAGGGSPGDLRFAEADLLSDAGWDDAVKGCTYVLHVASPLGGALTESEDQLVAAARGGALRVLGAAARAGVKRVVMTSSGAASAAPLQGPDSINDESVWTDPADPALNPYRRSKLLSERAAWEFAKAHPEMEFCTILPAAIFGPILAKESLSSAAIALRMLQGKLPGLPRIGFCVVDVRDLATLHVSALTAPAAAGQRFTAAGDFMWMADVAQSLRERLGAKATKVPTRRLPNWFVRLLARFNPEIRAIAPTLGRRHLFVSDKAKQLLGYAPRPGAVSVGDTGESLIAFNLV